MTDVTEGQEEDGETTGATGGDDVEAEAREQGWAPEEEWEGDPPTGGFRTAEEFIAYGKERGPAMREQNERLTEELAESRRTNEETQRTLAKFSEYNDGIQTRALAQARDEVEGERRAAVENGDLAAYDAAGEKDAKLDKAEGDAAAAVSPDDLPGFKDWHRENDWYQDDIDMTVWAQNAAPIVTKKTGLTEDDGRKFYDAIGDAVRVKFPEHFENANRDDPPNVEGGGKPNSGSRGGGKTYADLPAEAKAACDEFCKTMVRDSSGKEVPLMTRKKYADQYDWSES